MCVLSKNGVTVSASPVEVLQSDPTGLQSQLPWGFLVPFLDPKAEKGLITFTIVGELVWYYVLHFVGPLFGKHET